MSHHARSEALLDYFRRDDQVLKTMQLIDKDISFEELFANAPRETRLVFSTTARRNQALCFALLLMA